MTKSLVIGATGMVGQALMRLLPNAVGTYNKSAIFQDFRHLDITNTDEIDMLLKDVHPDICYIPAYITNVDACEDEKTDDVNIAGTLKVINACIQLNIRPVFFSSSYVFDGESQYPYSPNQLPLPINYYGHQKASVEATMRFLALASMPYIIIRTIGVFGYDFNGKNFAMQVLSRIQNNVFSDPPRKIFVPNDQYMNPIHVDDLAKITIELAENRPSGIYHVAGDICRNKYEFAKDILAEGGITVGLNMLEGVDSEHMLQRAKRPKMGCLDCTDLPKLGIKIPSYKDGLKRFFE